MDPLNSQTTHSKAHPLQVARDLGKTGKEAWLIVHEAVSRFLGPENSPTVTFPSKVKARYHFQRHSCIPQSS